MNLYLFIIYQLSVIQLYFSAQMLFASGLTGNLGRRTAVPEFDALSTENMEIILIY